ncbi:MAG: PEP-CTERM sorting domain-containing protein [Leptospirales bacterium]
MKIKQVLFSALCFALLGAWMGVSSPSAFASFSECAGSGFSCNGLITVGSGGSLSLAIDPTVAPVDGFDDTMLGVLNNSGHSLSSIALNFGGTTQIFPNSGNVDGFNGVSGVNGYNGPDTTFSGVNSIGNSGTVNFTTALANGSSTYFEVEAGPSAFGNGGTIGGTPEPSTLILLGTGLFIWGMMNRKKLGIDRI